MRPRLSKTALALSIFYLLILGLEELAAYPRFAFKWTEGFTHQLAHRAHLLVGFTLLIAAILNRRSRAAESAEPTSVRWLAILAFVTVTLTVAAGFGPLLFAEQTEFEQILTLKGKEFYTSPVIKLHGVATRFHVRATGSYSLRIVKNEREEGAPQEGEVLSESIRFDQGEMSSGPTTTASWLEPGEYRIRIDTLGSWELDVYDRRPVGDQTDK